jgi:hypothetical protein
MAAVLSRRGSYLARAPGAILPAGSESAGFDSALRRSAQPLRRGLETRFWLRWVNKAARREPSLDARRPHRKNHVVSVLARWDPRHFFVERWNPAGLG